jgi:hypothetical protein
MVHFDGCASCEKPKFSLPQLLSIISSNHQVASHLVSKDSCLSCPASSSWVNDSVIDRQSGVSNTKYSHVYLFQRHDGAGNEPMDETANHEKVLGDCKLFYIKRNLHEEGFLIVQTDPSNPLGLLRNWAPPVPGLRRVICLKLDGFGYTNTYLVTVYFWLNDGTSSMILSVYTLAPECYCERYFIHFRKLTFSRIPSFSDVSEVFLAREQDFCPFCTAESYIAREDSGPLKKRLKNPYMAENPWRTYKANSLVLETGPKRYACLLENQSYGVFHEPENFARIIGSLDGNEVYSRGFLACLEVLNPFVGSHTPSLFDRNSRECAGFSKNLLGNSIFERLSPAEISTSVQDIAPGALPSPEGIGSPSPFSGSRDETPWKAMESIANEHLARSHVNPRRRRSPLARPFSDDAEIREEDAEILKYFEELAKYRFSADEQKVCRICQYSFLRAHDLKRHVQAKHLQRRSYDCGICGMLFTRQSHVSIHVKSKHENVQFPCPHCDRVFSYDGARRRHMKGKHEDLVQDT